MVNEKMRGKQNEKIIYGNHLFAFDSEVYLHGVLYNMAKVVDCSCSLDKIVVMLTSPLIGLQQLTFSYSNTTKKADTKVKAS